MKAIFELDDDGYPTNECLSSISITRPSEGQTQADWLLETMAGIRGIWQYDCWHETDGKEEIWGLPARRINISTIGWSGNEDLIRAWKSNFILWHLTWRIHQVGGHYTFEVRLEDPPPYKPQAETQTQTWEESDLELMATEESKQR